MELQDALEAIQQPRTRYQLEHFVLGQHDTAEMQFHQLCLEIQVGLRSLRTAEVGIRKCELEIKRLLETGDEMDALDAEEKTIALEHSNLLMIGARREMQALMDIFHSIPHFTRDEIDHAQPEYWEKRMIRQTNLQIMAGSLGWAQLDAMGQVGLLDELVEARQADLVEQAKAELSQ
jgi:hypothetical protein